MPYKSKRKRKNYMKDYMSDYRAERRKLKNHLRNDIESMRALRRNFPTAYELLFGKTQKQRKRK